MCFLKSRLFIALLTFVVGILAASFYYHRTYQHPIVEEIKSNDFVEVEQQISGFDEVVKASNGSFITTFGWIDLKGLCQNDSKRKSGICTATLIGNSPNNWMNIELQICNKLIKSNCIDFQNSDISKDDIRRIYNKNSNLIDGSQIIKITSRVSVVDGKGRFANPIARIENVNSKNEIAPLSTVDLRTINRLDSKGRVQDIDLNNLKEIDTLIAHGKESIPFLINKLTDNRKVQGTVIIDYWSDVRVGDAAFIILTDFFTTTDERNSTIEGTSFDDFLGCHNPMVSADQCYYNYIQKNGRKTIQARWQKIWEQNKDKIYWSETERNFRID